MTDTASRRSLLLLVLSTSATLLITMGARQTSGLFLLPITESSGVSVVALSFSLAVAQFVYGAAQPIFGAVADKYGLTLVSHQAGGFLGAWLGGIALAQQGSYVWIWYADMILALLAAAANFPIKEAPIPKRAVAAA